MFDELGICIDHLGLTMYLINSLNLTLSVLDSSTTSRFKRNTGDWGCRFGFLLLLMLLVRLDQDLKMLRIHNNNYGNLVPGWSLTAGDVIYIRRAFLVKLSDFLHWLQQLRIHIFIAVPIRIFISESK